MLCQKKGFSSISALLLLITTFVIGLVLVSYLISATDKLVGKSGEIQKEAAEMIRLVEIIEIRGEDPREGEINKFTIDIKLMGSNKYVLLDKLTLRIADQNGAALLIKREDGDVQQGNTGYNTWSQETILTLRNYEYPFPVWTFALDNIAWFELPADLDEDGQADYARICDGSGNPCPPTYDGTHIVFDISSAQGYHYAHLIDTDGQVIDVSSVPVLIDIEQAPISGGYGYISLSGEVLSAYAIGWNNENVTLYTAKYALDDDLDDDGLDDYLYINTTHAILEISSLDTQLSYSLGADITNAPTSINFQEDITYEGEKYASLRIQGTSQTDNYLDENVNIQIRPAKNGKGYFVMEYLKQSENRRTLNGRMVSGDILRIHAETYSPLIENEVVQVQFIYSGFESASKNVYTGDTFVNRSSITLFPQV